MPAAVNLATEAQVDALIKLEHLCFEQDRVTVSQLKRWLKHKTALIPIISSETFLIASAIVLFRKNSRRARLYSFAVHPAFRQKHYAQTLHDYIEQYCHQKHCNTIYLEVRKDNYKATQFYIKNGYRIFGEYLNFYEDGATAIRMEKSLTIY